MANLSTAGISKFRRWYTQYKAIHGTEPPTDMMDNYLSAEMEADAASQDSSRLRSLQERQVSLQESAQAQRAAEYAQDLKLRKDALKANDQAAMVSGVKDIVGLGIEAKRAGIIGGDTRRTETPSYSGGLVVAKAPVSDAYSGYGVNATPSVNMADAVNKGMGASSGFGYQTGTSSGLSDTGSAIDLSRYSGYGSDAGVSYTDPALSTTAGTGTGGINWRGLGTGIGTSLAIGAANRFITPALQEKAYAENPEAGKSLSVASGALEGFAAGRGLGPAGMIAGTILGTERAGYRQDNQGGEIFDKDYNKQAGFASMFGITAGQIERKSDTKTVKTAKAILTGGVSHAAGSVFKKLKKLF